MFNVAVINIKDIGKIAIKLLVAIIFIATLISLLNNKKSDRFKIDYFFSSCFDICIPGLKQIEFEKQETITLSKLLSIDLPMKNNVIIQELEQQKNENTEIEIKKVSDKTTDDYTISIPKNISTEVLQSNVPESYTDDINEVHIKNGTDFELTEDMILRDVEFKNPKKILIYHTHTSESYTPSEEFHYEMTGNFRTTDLDYTVARVGTELTNYLKKLRV